LNEYSKAEPLYQKALEIQFNSLSENDPNIAQTMGNLATLYSSLAQYSKAEPLPL